MTILPESELDTVVMTVLDANSLATAGDVLRGYRCLLEDENCAKDLQARGMPWTETLVARYRMVLDRYGEEWGL